MSEVRPVKTIRPLWLVGIPTVLVVCILALAIVQARRDDPLAEFSRLICSCLDDPNDMDAFYELSDMCDDLEQRGVVQVTRTPTTLRFEDYDVKATRREVDELTRSVDCRAHIIVFRDFSDESTEVIMWSTAVMAAKLEGPIAQIIEEARIAPPDGP